MIIPNSLIEEIKERANIVDVISEYVNLKKRGNNWVGLCPFHTEKTPSFTVNEEKKIYHCFGCGANGNVFSFLMNIDNLSFVEAVKDIASRYDIEITTSSSNSDNKSKEAIEQISEILRYATNFYQTEYRKQTENSLTKEYVKLRKINDDMMKIFKIGYSPDNWDSLLKYLVGLSYKHDIIEKSGLIIKNKNNRIYDRFRNRLMFPICNEKGKTIAFGGRIIGEGEPKYLNSSDSLLFQKRKILYNLNNAKDTIKKTKKTIIVEGYFDVIALFQHGIENVVAPLGTALTEEHVHLLKRYSDEIILIFDGDNAGLNATDKAIQIAIMQKMPVYIITLRDNHDPYDFIFKYGKDEFIQLLDNKQEAINFKLEIEKRNLDLSNNQHIRLYLERIFSFLKQINDQVLIDTVLSKISNNLKIKEQIIRNEYKNIVNKENRYKKNWKNQDNSNENEEIDGSVLLQRSIILCLILNPTLFDEYFYRIHIDFFSDSYARELFNIVEKNVEKGSYQNIEELSNQLSNEEIKKRFMKDILEKEDLYKKEARKQMEQYINKLSLYKVRSKKNKYRIELDEAIKKQNKESMKNCLEQIQFYSLEEKKILQSLDS